MMTGLGVVTMTDHGVGRTMDPGAVTMMGLGAVTMTDSGVELMTDQDVGMTMTDQTTGEARVVRNIGARTAVAVVIATDRAVLPGATKTAELTARAPGGSGLLTARLAVIAWASAEARLRVKASAVDLVEIAARAAVAGAIARAAEKGKREDHPGGTTGHHAAVVKAAAAGVATARPDAMTGGQMTAVHRHPGTTERNRKPEKRTEIGRLSASVKSAIVDKTKSQQMFTIANFNG